MFDDAQKEFDKSVDKRMMIQNHIHPPSKNC